jgi:integrase
LKLAPLVFVRPGELRKAEWAEFDLEHAEWRIPAAKMKMRRRLHRVPLSKQALAIIRDSQAFSRDGRWLFPSVRSISRPMSENTLNAALRRLGYSKTQMTAHGFKGMASTRLNEMGCWNPEAIERQLAHQEADDVRRAYMHAARILAGTRQDDASLGRLRDAGEGHPADAPTSAPTPSASGRLNVTTGIAHLAPI